MNRARLRWLLPLCLAGTLALAWFAPGEDKVAPTGRKASAQRRAPQGPEATASAAALADRNRLANAERQPLPPDDIPDLFKSISWYVAPPPPPAAPPLPPPKPTAPPLPFAFIGQYVEGNRPLIILARGDRVMTVSIGEVIDNTYKIQSMTNGQLMFVYLPLSTIQSLSTGVIQ
jgi:hypothetical protein